MTRLGPGRTRATIAWLAGAIMACALIGTCLALLRSDILPFRDAWPNAQGSRTGVSQLAAPQAASQPVGRPSFAAQPTTVGGAPVIVLPGLPTATTTGPLSPAGSTPLAGTPGSGSTTRTQTTDGGRLGQPTTSLPTFPAPTPTFPAPTPTLPAPTPTSAASSVPDVAGAVPDVPVPVATANRTGPSGRLADATRADDDAPLDTTVPETSDTPASPVDDGVPAGPPVDSTPTAPVTEPTPAPSTPADPSTPDETAPAGTTPPSDATAQPADPGPEPTPPAPASTPTPDPPPAPASTPTPDPPPAPPATADSAPQPDPSPAPAADPAAQPDAPAPPAG